MGEVLLDVRTASSLAGHQLTAVNTLPEVTVIVLTPVTLEGRGVRLEPLSPAHQDGLAAAAADGRLWELWFTFVPEPEQTAASSPRRSMASTPGTW